MMRLPTRREDVVRCRLSVVGCPLSVESARMPQRSTNRQPTTRRSRPLTTTMRRVSALKNRDHYPALVVGTGIAGLTASFCLAKAGIRVLLVTKAADPKDCNTFWAQGGIIYEGEGDSPAKLIEDVIAAGAGLSNEEAVRFLAEEGPRVVKELLLDEMHVPFSVSEEGELDL